MIYDFVNKKFVEFLTELCNYYADLNYWQIKGIVKNPNLTGYQEQNTSMEFFKKEFIDQIRLAEDMYEGKIFLKLDNDTYLEIHYCT